MKNNRSSRDDGIGMERIKKGGTKQLKTISKLYNACLRNSIIPDKWNNADVILIHEKKILRRSKSIE